MKSFIARLEETRRISVWGLGYLGFTLMLDLQAHGFWVDIYDANQSRIEAFQDGTYPVDEQKLIWSSKGDFPSVDMEHVSVHATPETLFHNAVHFVSFPGRSDKGQSNRLSYLLEAFCRHGQKLKDVLVVFQSAEAPGDVERFFSQPLSEAGIGCSIAAAFRTDWSIEEYYTRRAPQVVAANDAAGLEKIIWLMTQLEREAVPLGGLREAEIYESARKSLQQVYSSFVNQIAMAYSDLDVRRVAHLLTMRNHCFGIRPSLGTIGYKPAIATGHLIEGSHHSDRLSMVRDANAANLSIILSYAEMIMRQRLSQIAILGLCEQGDQKDVRLSPALVLAEHLLGQGVEVWIHDPYFSSREIRNLVPGAVCWDMPNRPITLPGIVLMTGHRFYRYLHQGDLDRLGITDARLVIDNAAIWSDYRFSAKTVYHVPGDGCLAELER
ncbi:hypothetical protein GF348_14335 [candidate division KSB3 bacterium]|nr:hypothetical protein [candidate division KSB3 bacterium]